MKLKRIESGIYSTPDRKFQVERVGSIGEFDTYTDCWVVMQYDSAEAADDLIGAEIYEAPTKRECVEWLDRRLDSPI